VNSVIVTKDGHGNDNSSETHFMTQKQNVVLSPPLCRILTFPQWPLSCPGDVNIKYRDSYKVMICLISTNAYRLSSKLAINILDIGQKAPLCGFVWISEYLWFP